MGKLIYSYLTSLDGFIADEGGKFNWAEPNEEVLAFINEVERPIRTYLYGRRMYETMICWETDPKFAQQSSDMHDFAQMWQAADKIVFSSTLNAASTRKTRIERDFNPDAIKQLKSTTSHDIAIAGATLASHAVRAGVVDEYHLFVTPILVGGGRKLFPSDIRVKLELLAERRFANGFIFLKYAAKD